MQGAQGRRLAAPPGIPGIPGIPGVPGTAALRRHMSTAPWVYSQKVARSHSSGLASSSNCRGHDAAGTIVAQGVCSQHHGSTGIRIILIARVMHRASHALGIRYIAHCTLLRHPAAPWGMPLAPAACHWAGTFSSAESMSSVSEAALAVNTSEGGSVNTSEEGAQGR